MVMMEFRAYLWIVPPHKHFIFNKISRLAGKHKIKTVHILVKKTIIMLRLVKLVRSTRLLVHNVSLVSEVRCMWDRLEEL